MLRMIPGLSVIVVLALLCAAMASAQSGREDYQHYCAACHGQDGKGKGEWNGTEVPDLTHLSRDNSGRFPSEDVQKVVDGRSQPLWHQRTRDMPLLGRNFSTGRKGPSFQSEG